MAVELAREIIAQSRPVDRPSPLTLLIKTGGDVEVMEITAPTKSGEQVLQVDFWLQREQKQKILQYHKSNIEGAARFVQLFMDEFSYRYGEFEVFMCSSDEKGVGEELCAHCNDAKFEKILGMMKALVAS